MLPETTAGGLIVPESYRESYDGSLFEVVAVSDQIAKKLCVVADMGETLVVGLSDDIDGKPLELQPDDIIKTKRLFTGQHSPEMSLYFGYDVWFVNAIEKQDGRLVCAIQTVWPSKNWKEEAA